MANAWEVPGGQFSLDAKEETSYRRFIKVNTDGQAEVATSASDPIVGISYTDAPAGTPISIIGSGIAMAEAVEAVTAGDFVTAGTAGKVAVSNDATPFIALTSAAAGDLTTVKIG